MLGEEARDPLRAIPRAVLTTVLLALAYYVFVTWAMAIGFGAGERGRLGGGSGARSTRSRRATSATGSRW